MYNLSDKLLFVLPLNECPLFFEGSNMYLNKEVVLCYLCVT